jgi:hypothetical protein
MGADDMSSECVQIGGYWIAPSSNFKARKWAREKNGESDMGLNGTQALDEVASLRARAAELVSHLSERIDGTKKAAEYALAKRELDGMLRTSARKAALEQTLEFVTELFPEAGGSK